MDRVQDVTKPVLERYRRHLYHYRKENGEPLSFATQQQRLLPLRAFFKWLSKENYTLSNPASELELPRVHRKLPAHILSREDVEAVLEGDRSIAGLIGVPDALTQIVQEAVVRERIREGMEAAGASAAEIDSKNS